MASKRIMERVRRAAARRLLYLPHALRQMARPERMITSSEVRAVVELGELVEDYPMMRAGTAVYCSVEWVSGVFMSFCAPKEEYLAIITAYIPSADEWEPDLERGERSELCPLPRQDEAFDGAVSY